MANSILIGLHARIILWPGVRGLGGGVGGCFSERPRLGSVQLADDAVVSRNDAVVFQMSLAGETKDDNHDDDHDRDGAMVTFVLSTMTFAFPSSLVTLHRAPTASAISLH